MNTDDIKQLEMSDVAARYGFEPNRAGNILCPFHDEKTPSLKIYPGAGRGWHCFGCNKGGSAVDFVMYLFNLDFKQAAMRLSIDFNMISDYQDDTQKSNMVQKRKAERARKAQNKREIQQLSEIHCQLWQTIKDGPVWSDEWCDAQNRIDHIAHRIEVLECRTAKTLQ